MHTTGKIKNKRALARNCFHTRRPMALPSHADQERRSLARADLLQAAALERGAGGPLVGTGTFDTSQLRKDSRIRIQNLDPVGDAVAGLLEDEAQNVAAR